MTGIGQRKYLLTFSFVLVAAWIGACEPRGTDEAAEFAGCGVPSRVSFQALQSQVLQKFRCMECHAEFTNESAVKALTVPGHPERSELVFQVRSGMMPPSGPRVPDCAVAITEKYVAQLSEDSTPTPDPDPVTQPGPDEVNYATVRARVLDVSCKGCHGVQSDPNPRRMNLADESVVRANAAEILARMKDTEDPMPPSRSTNPKPGAAELSLFEQWMGAGMP